MSPDSIRFEVPTVDAVVGARTKVGESPLWSPAEHALY